MKNDKINRNRKRAASEETDFCILYANHNDHSKEIHITRCPGFIYYSCELEHRVSVN